MYVHVLHQLYSSFNADFSEKQIPIFWKLSCRIDISFWIHTRKCAEQKITWKKPIIALFLISILLHWRYFYVCSTWYCYLLYVLCSSKNLRFEILICVSVDLCNNKYSNTYCSWSICIRLTVKNKYAFFHSNFLYYRSFHDLGPTLRNSTTHLQ